MFLFGTMTSKIYIACLVGSQKKEEKMCIFMNSRAFEQTEHLSVYYVLIIWLVGYRF